MAARPAYLQGVGCGRGRGRGHPGESASPPRPQSPHWRGQNGSGTENRLLRNSSSGGSSPDSPHRAKTPISADDRFQTAATKHQVSMQRHLQADGANGDGYESSDEEESLNDQGILQSMMKSFSTNSG